MARMLCMFVIIHQSLLMEDDLLNGCEPAPPKRMSVASPNVSFLMTTTLKRMPVSKGKQFTKTPMSAPPNLERPTNTNRVLRNQYPPNGLYRHSNRWPLEF